MRWLVALLLALAQPGYADPLVFEGRIEASERAVLSSRLNGVVAEILFNGGERVSAGQPLIRLDPTDAALALEISEARLAASRARYDGATRRTARQEEMHERGITTDSTLGAARTEMAMVEAELALAEAERRRAVLDLERVVIRAPISGLISPPSVSIGAFLEAEARPAACDDRRVRPGGRRVPRTLCRAAGLAGSDRLAKRLSSCWNASACACGCPATGCIPERRRPMPRVPRSMPRRAL